ncbi:MAG: diaminopimelate decarboxylase [Candidatus Micrarchaeaceae archaeon]|jgi:diaminopimelate decarboxylase|nr:diaminopimelate decarboxylase [Candidatus Micrarchaeota archaeon]HII09776.1 diaminopimelate decarboxylase [Candidatus Micrarchaeota archaeon]
MWWEVPNHLKIKHGELYIAGKSAAKLGREAGTPVYVYNGKRVVENYRRFYSTLKKYTERELRVCYAMKANSNPDILKLLKKEGAWVDVVSPEEAERALSVGFDSEKVLFTGTSVSNSDLKRISDMGIMVNIDSVSELKRLGRIGKSGMRVSIRMDPGINGSGHSWKVTTAGRSSHGVPIKFSIPREEVLDVARMCESDSFRLAGLHIHVGSNWRTNEEISEFINAVDLVLDTARQVSRALGHELEFIDLGGGPGVRYMESQKEFPLDEYARQICKRIDGSHLSLNAIAFEPGRYIVADSGIMLMEVVDVKKRYGDLIVGVNSGFNHMARAAMYDSYHEIINCAKAGKKADTHVVIAGNLCETGDVFTKEPRLMPKPEEGDILAIHNAGAYGYTMASRYNLRDLPKEIVL